MAGEKTALVLLPGLLLDHRLWRHQVEGLADIASITVGDLTEGDSVPEIAARVLERAPPRFALAGLSMGGYVALEMVAQAPARIERLALLDTTARADSPAHSQRRRDFLALAERGPFKGVTPRLLPTYLHPDHVDDAAISGPVLAMAADLGREVFKRQTRAAMSRRDARDRLPAIACPTLVLCGREDQVTPPELAREMADAIPRADLVVLAHCGHLPPLERPKATTGHLRLWLSGE